MNRHVVIQEFNHPVVYVKEELLDDDVLTLSENESPVALLHCGIGVLNPDLLSEWKR